MKISDKTAEKRQIYWSDSLNDSVTIHLPLHTSTQVAGMGPKDEFKGDFTSLHRSLKTADECPTTLRTR